MRLPSNICLVQMHTVPTSLALLSQGVVSLQSLMWCDHYPTLGQSYWSSSLIFVPMERTYPERPEERSFLIPEPDQVQKGQSRPPKQWESLEIT
ncbi:hypothetical protein Y1Q_0013056 [Alligator mississippiensis]|uniref:Uncharacterized protein n=1 Tax=Alligator mississippiensis TaxID=8496 RepID=A0A151NGS4_ALLMI|nr:hypothetical protein Y1Q_0013056 [Alligator mississippiensis]